MFGLLYLMLLAQALPVLQAAPEQTLVPLRKVTVGPYDNFDGVQAPGEILYYTRSQNLSTRIYRLDRKTGLSEPISPEESDAKEPAPSPDGKLVAFTSFGKDAKGDICFVEKKKMECIPSKSKSERSPFWLDAERIAFVQASDEAKTQTLQSYDLRKKTSVTLARAAIVNPHLSPDRRLVLWKGLGNQLEIFELASNKIQRSLTIDLPGTTGLARWSADQKSIYFTQYIIDSNRDLRLDGRDAAAIFRLDLADQVPRPYPITSLAQNCSYPFPGQDELWVTCAFEAALDIYRLPLGGVIPQSWQKADLEEAHLVSRSYADRLLFLYAQRARFAPPASQEANEALLMNYALLKAWKPAQFYAEKNQGPDAAALSLLFEGLARWDNLPKKENLGAFAEWLQQAKQQNKGQSALQPLLQGYFDFFAKNHSLALQHWREFVAKPGISLYLKAYAYQLMPQPGADRKAFLEQAAADPRLSQESRYFYLAQRLPAMEDPDGDAELSRLARVFAGQAEILELIAQEQDLRTLVRAPQAEQQKIAKRSVIARVKRQEKNYQIMRFLYHRTIVSLFQGRKSEDLASLLSFWLSYVKSESKEYAFALDHLRQSSTDLAYLYLARQDAKRVYAKGAFMDSIRSSDDLESHYQYALSQWSEKAWPELETAYQGMLRDQLIHPDSKAFVSILQELWNKGDKVSVSDLQEAISRLEAMRDKATGLGLRYLLVGALSYQQLLLQKEGFRYDRKLAERAHSAYLFAIDAAFGNERLQASALQNLGLLHQETRNFSLAAEFFLKRLELGFATQEDELGIMWLAADALYRSYRFEEALSWMEKALQRQPRQEFREKAAFYAWNAGHWEKAKTYYEELFQQAAYRQPSFLLSYGYVLGRMQKTGPAAQALDEAITLSQGKAWVASSKGMLHSQPEKLRFLAYGLKAQLALPWPEKIKAMQQRLSLFAEMKAKAREYYFQEETLRAQELKEQQDLALWYWQAQDPAAAAQTLALNLKGLKAFGEDFGYLAYTIFVGVKNQIILANQHGLKLGKDWESLMQAAEAEWQKESRPGAEVLVKWTELRLLKNAYLLKAKDPSGASFSQFRTGLWQEPALLSLKREKPELFADLNDYAEALSRDFWPFKTQARITSSLREEAALPFPSSPESLAGVP